MMKKLGNVLGLRVEYFIMNILLKINMYKKSFQIINWLAILTPSDAGHS